MAEERPLRFLSLGEFDVALPPQAPTSLIWNQMEGESEASRLS
jgi:hypothetical protein